MSEKESIIYGLHAVEELVGTRQSDIEHIYFSQDRKNPSLFSLLKICRKKRLPYHSVPPEKLQSLAKTDKHQGVVAVCSARSYCSAEHVKEIIDIKSVPLFVVPASVEDPGNLGALIRTCVAFNVDALLLERKNTVGLTAAVAKRSAGMIEHLCISRPKNLSGLLEEFVAKGFSIVGAHAEKGRIPTEINFVRPTILILGGEHRGLPPYLARLCSDYVKIPMTSRAQSLNVSAAGAVLLYECMRQRDFNTQ